MTVRDFLWLAFIIAIAVAWLTDHQWQHRRIEELTPPPVYYRYKPELSR